MEENKLLKKVDFFFFALDYFIDVLTTVLGLERGSYIAVYGGSENSRISSKIF